MKRTSVDAIPRRRTPHGAGARRQQQHRHKTLVAIRQNGRRPAENQGTRSAYSINAGTRKIFSGCCQPTIDEGSLPDSS